MEAVAFGEMGGGRCGQFVGTEWRRWKEEKGEAAGRDKEGWHEKSAGVFP